MVELYTKVVIAFFTFVGPSFTLLTSIFLEGIEKRRKKFEVEKETTENLIKEQVTSNSGNLDDTLKKGAKTLGDHKKKTKKELNLLNPKRQVVRIFLTLGVSIGFIIAFHLYKWLCNRSVLTETEIVKISLLVISLSAFSWAVYVLWQLFCTIIEAKKELIKKPKALTARVKSDNQNPSTTETR